jgi:hypothetical protein
VREVAFVRKLITCLLVALTFGSVISFQSAAIAGDACVSRAEFRAAERGMRIRQVQHNFGTAGRVSNRNGSELVKSYVKCGGTQVTGPWAVITYDHRRLVRKVWEIPGAD